MKIRTKQIGSRWHCYATFNNMDHAHSGKSIYEVQSEMLRTLILNEIKEYHFLEPVEYINKPILEKAPIGYSNNRIDNL